MGGEAHDPTLVVLDVPKAERRLGRIPTMPPQARGGLEPVVGQQAPAIGRDQVHGREDEFEHGIADEVVEVHPDPARLDPLAPALDLALELAGRFEVDPEQAMAVRAGA